MAYYIQRQMQQFGPYSLEEIKRDLAQGKIALGDLARSDGMSNWIPLGQLIGSSELATAAASSPGLVPAQSVTTDMRSASVAYGAASQLGPVTPRISSAPVPPDFHWAAVFVLGLVTFGLFSLVWLCIEASFVKKIKPTSNFVLFLVLALIPGLGIVFAIIGIFKMRDAIQEYYNTVEPINLRLSGVMTFFFALLYFQYHFSRIAQWKQTGYLQPQ